MAIISFSIVLVVGFWRHGFHFFSLFIPHGTPKPLLPLIFLIELLSFMVRPFSLALRLFVAAALGGLLASQLYGVTPTDPVTIAATTAQLRWPVVQNWVTDCREAGRNYGAVIVERLKELVMNGPNTYPGANYIIRPDGVKIRLDYVTDRKAIADSLAHGYIVERHLADGDTRQRRKEFALAAFQHYVDTINAAVRRHCPR